MSLKLPQASLKAALLGADNVTTQDLQRPAPAAGNLSSADGFPKGRAVGATAPRPDRSVGKRLARRSTLNLWEPLEATPVYGGGLFGVEGPHSWRGAPPQPASRLKAAFQSCLADPPPGITTPEGPNAGSAHTFNPSLTLALQSPSHLWSRHSFRCFKHGTPQCGMIAMRRTEP